MADTTCLREFCRAMELARAVRERYRPILRDLRNAQAGAKEALFEIMREHGAKCLPVSNSLSPSPQFVRLCEKKYMVALNETLIQDALNGLPDGTLEQADPVRMTQLVYDALHAVRSMVRERIEVSAHCARDKSTVGSVENTGERVDACVAEYLRTGRALEEARARMREELNGYASTVSEQGTSVEMFMEQQDITSQPVTLTDAAGTRQYFIRRKTRRVKPALNAATTKGLIARTLRSILDSGGPVQPRAVASAIWKAVRERPATEQETLTLDRARCG